MFNLVSGGSWEIIDNEIEKMYSNFKLLSNMLITIIGTVVGFILLFFSPFHKNNSISFLFPVPLGYHALF